VDAGVVALGRPLADGCRIVLRRAPQPGSCGVGDGLGDAGSAPLGANLALPEEQGSTIRTGYRPRARTEHANSIDRATATIRRIDRALLKLDSRENALIGQLAPERATRRPERTLERAVRTRERGRGMGLGL